MSKILSLPNLLTQVRTKFEQVKDPLTSRANISLTDCLMSGLAIFNLKFPSLLQFEKGKQNPIIANNLKTLFQINKSPCDTYLRERLDVIEPAALRKSFTALFAMLQRAKYLEPYQFYQGTYLVSVDATGCFSSHDINCESCCVKNHRNGTRTYYHQTLSAVLVHPDLPQVIPFAPEIICQQDGTTKNDCERNASKRLLTDLRREHPHLTFTVIEDSLYANGPHIKLLKSLNANYIINVKPGDHAYLFDAISASNCNQYKFTDEKGYIHEFKFINSMPLNDTHNDLLVNFLDYTETSPKGKIKHFSWITDFTLTDSNVFTIMKGARARWHIENQTFNTLKNQGYHFEHNFGHGNKYLCNVFIYLMFLAFFIDQISAMCCNSFKKALKKSHSMLSYLWRDIREFFCRFFINSWDDLYRAIIEGYTAKLIFDTS